jgi:CDP-diacylglycerol--glycerol-3-phosphate 3-phosphatidyltransferase
MTIADALTYSRLILGPAVFFLLLHGSAPSLWIALALTIVAELTDFLDGWFARRARTVSDVGKVADPFTDSFYRLSVFLGLCAAGRFPLWLFLFLFYRDASNMFLRQLAALRGFALSSRWSGKIKAGVLAVTAWVLITDMLLDCWPEWFTYWGSVGITIYVLGSGLDYLLANLGVFRKEPG